MSNNVSHTLDHNAFHVYTFSHSTEWLDALMNDNVETASSILQSATTNYKDFLMNGDIPTLNKNIVHPANQKTSPSRSAMEFNIRKPLHAAAIFHSHAVLKLLWESGVDVLQVDSCENNVVHMLVYADFTAKAPGTRYAETLQYLQRLFTDSELKSLLLAENVLSLRPLELAALYGCFILALAILHTKGVYRIKEERVGYNVVQYFDISDYELFHNGMPPRFFQSPLLLADISHIEALGAEAILDHPLLKSWMRAKMLMNWPFILIWLLFRLFFISLFASAALENSWPSAVNNASVYKTNNTGNMVICSSETSHLGSYRWYALASLSISILIYDFYNYQFTRRLYHPAVKKLLHHRHSITYIIFFYWTQIATHLSVVGISTCQILRCMGFTVPSILDHIFFIAVSIGSMWGAVYFLQILPWSSIYAIAIQRMLQDLFRFVIIFFLFLCAFALSFRRILLGNSNECPKGFDTLGETIYSSFLVLINLVNFREYENADNVSLFLLHMMFVFFISILLINFLIAAMTQSFSDVHSNRRIIIQTQRLSLMTIIQMRLAGPFKALYKRLQKDTYVYYNGRLCVHHTLIIDKNTEPTAHMGGTEI